MPHLNLVMERTEDEDGSASNLSKILAAAAFITVRNLTSFTYPTNEGVTKPGGDPST